MTRLFVKKLTVIDFSYLHAQRGLLGESWIVDIELQGSLDHQGMVLDFSSVKKKVKQQIDEHFDHKLLIPSLYAESSTEELGKRLKNHFRTTTGDTIEHIAPQDAYCFVESEEITPDVVAKAIERNLKTLLPENVAEVKISLYPETIDGHFYHYSHGLKHHNGNCQRIAHGHRSRIQIFENNQPVEPLEKEWAEKWQDIYIGTKTDIVDQPELNGEEYIRFSYTACQGLFELVLPARKCYLIDEDSTVENIAEHLAEKIKQQHPQKHYCIYAYEGVDKGAIGIT